MLGQWSAVRSLAWLHLLEMMVEGYTFARFMKVRHCIHNGVKVTLDIKQQWALSFKLLKGKTEV